MNVCALVWNSFVIFEDNNAVRMRLRSKANLRTQAYGIYGRKSIVSNIMCLASSSIRKHQKAIKLMYCHLAGYKKTGNALS